MATELLRIRYDQLKMRYYCFQEAAEDYLIAASELSHLTVPSFVVGEADPDHDSSVNDNVSSVSGVDLTESRYRWTNRLDSPDLLLSDNVPAATLSPDGAVVDINNTLTDVEDSTEDEEGKVICTKFYYCRSWRSHSSVYDRSPSLGHW
jgi:hypothetical protein